PEGFTLIEVAAVILVMGILAAAAVLSLAHVVTQHRIESPCQQLEEADRLMRSAARQSGQTQLLVFDLESNVILWQHPGTTSPGDADVSSTTDYSTSGQETKPVTLLRLMSKDELVLLTPE